jgi:N-acetylmuramoyl-L-alanine amidase
VLAEQNGWLQIRLPSGQTGWISAAFAFVTTRQANAQPGGTSPLAGKTIVIDPGHGGTNPGAVGSGGLMEKVVALDVSLRVAALLQSAGATVVMTRSADTALALAPRVSVAEAVNAHVFVSIHANAHPNPAIGGTETYYYAYKAAAAASQRLAGHIQRQLVGALGLRDIGVKHGNFHVIRETTMPAVLVELAFLSNAYEESLMRTDAFRQASAGAIFEGLENYFTW